MVDEGFNEFVLNLGRDVFEPQRASGHCRPRSLPETQTRRMECIGSGGLHCRQLPAILRDLRDGNGLKGGRGQSFIVSCGALQRILP